MTAPLNPTTQRLIAEIERKDRRFRAAQAVFLSFIAIGFVASAWFLYSSLTSSQAKTERAIGQQTEYIRCLAKVFAQPPKTTVTIKDLDKCKLNSRPQAAQGDNTKPAIAIAQPQQQPPLTMANPAPAGTTQPSAKSSGSTPPPKDKPEQRPALEVLGIPVCEALTGLCVRQ